MARAASPGAVDGWGCVRIRRFPESIRWRPTMPQLQPTASATPSSHSRTRSHTRSIFLEGYKRDDGLWDIEARLTDRKDHDYTLASGVRPKGEAVHDMQVCVTIDGQFNILAAGAAALAAPYPGCAAIAPDYSAIIGLNLLRGFRRQVSDLFGGVKGCSHLTELLASLPTAAIQTFAGEVDETAPVGGGQPYQLDRCHALETSSETVRRYYPRWYRTSERGGQAPHSIPTSSTPPTSKEEA